MVMSEDEYETLIEEGLSSEEIEEIIQNKRKEVQEQLSNLDRFMESEVYLKLSKDSKRPIQREYDMLQRQLYCECDDGYGDSCNICLQIWRRARYGWDIHDTNCACNSCSGYSGY